MNESAESEDHAVGAESEEVERSTTGHQRIDEALVRLDGLDDLEITQHPDEFDSIHRVLRESLGSAGRNGDAPDSP